MRHFPIYLDLRDRRVVVSGAGPCAVAKLRLLLKTEAGITVFGDDPDRQIRDWAAAGRLRLVPRRIEDGDAAEATLLYAANEDAAEDARAARIGRQAGALSNIVDNLEDSQFITPAIVDRAPVTVAIGTEGAAPVLARDIKRRIEEMLPVALGTLARIGQSFRSRADRLPMGPKRRMFWNRFYFRDGARALAEGGERAAHESLLRLLDETEATTPRGHVALIGAGPGDPELLTLKARRLLHEADVIVHDRLVGPGILDLARREAEFVSVGKTGFGPSWRQEDIDALIVAKARGGLTVARLKGGDTAIFARLDEEIAACEAAGISWEIVPGITAASAAAAALGQSLTQRGRNSDVRFLTGHDVQGFAEQDWRALARPGSVAAIYMAKRAATFLRGRLMIHGAAESTPVTVVENVSRPDQRIVQSRLIDLPDAMADIGGPAILLLGLEPRRAAALAALPEPRMKEVL